jgi:hypothetical protein
MGSGALNYLALVLAAIVSFAFGAAWYSALSKYWMAARGLSAADMVKARAEMGTIPVVYIIAFAAELIMAWMLAGVLLHLNQGGLPASVRTGMISAFFLWLGFVATTLVVNHAFQGARRTLTLIDGGHWLGVLLIQGAIIDGWGLR